MGEIFFVLTRNLRDEKKQRLRVVAFVQCTCINKVKIYRPIFILPHKGKEKYRPCWDKEKLPDLTKYRADLRVNKA